MYATYAVRMGDPVTGVAVPSEALVREGDGTMSVWTTVDKKHMVKRTVAVGREVDGLKQIVSGLKQGELVVTTGAIFLSNMLFTAGNAN
jgi:cobalt-zinc-cadmium efflux system membrane fusion protein